jgi:hypothetical protein
VLITHRLTELDLLNRPQVLYIQRGEVHGAEIRWQDISTHTFCVVWKSQANFADEAGVYVDGDGYAGWDGGQYCYLRFDDASYVQPHDVLRLHKHDEELITCTSCEKCVGDCYDEGGLGFDWHYKRHGGRCLDCRGPAPGEGNFMQVATAAELGPVLTRLPISIVAFIVEFITPRVMPPYTRADFKEHQLWDELLNDDETDDEFVRLMSIPGVVLYFGGRSNTFLDLRWFRVPGCTCCEFPCPCICAAAYAVKVNKFLGIPIVGGDSLQQNGEYWYGVEVWDRWGDEPCGKCAECVANTEV